MRKYQSLFTYLLLFLSLSLLLKFFGFISLSSGEIIGYALIFYGICDVYLSLGSDRKISLFFGTVFFLIGILLYVINNFLIFWGPSLLLPSIFLIPGFAYLILYIDSPANKKFLFTGILLILTGFILTIINGQFNLSTFYNSILRVSSIYWQVVLVAAIILILISFEIKK